MAKKVQLKERGTNVNIYPVTIKEAVGLGNVDNTSDANKPISTATQAALDELSKDIEIQKTISQLHPSSDITKDLIVEMNDGTVYSVPNIFIGAVKTIYISESKNLDLIEKLLSI